MALVPSRAGVLVPTRAPRLYDHGRGALTYVSNVARAGSDCRATRSEQPRDRRCCGHLRRGPDFAATQALGKPRMGAKHRRGPHQGHAQRMESHPGRSASAVPSGRRSSEPSQVGSTVRKCCGRRTHGASSRSRTGTGRGPNSIGLAFERDESLGHSVSSAASRCRRVVPRS